MHICTVDQYIKKEEKKDGNHLFGSKRAQLKA